MPRLFRLCDSKYQFARFTSAPPAATRRAARVADARLLDLDHVRAHVGRASRCRSGPAARWSSRARGCLRGAADMGRLLPSSRRSIEERGGRCRCLPRRSSASVRGRPPSVMLASGGGVKSIDSRAQGLADARTRRKHDGASNPRSHAGPGRSPLARRLPDLVGLDHLAVRLGLGHGRLDQQLAPRAVRQFGQRQWQQWLARRGRYRVQTRRARIRRGVRAGGRRARTTSCAASVASRRATA